ncbi:Munc13 (mammalian uncoordinated) homology domain [Rhizoctonia solani]|uniref:Munc13 (Mammalian uncoordinated) homology domain n=1 Tax=Rhizoctonia solani TaxID=456999 RepID=A0A8H7IEU4_9AGAM|nr:Munc13 (mammalian uncoordinated) homology domain [Rhizoctonia solani]
MSVNSTRSTVANGRLTDAQLYQYLSYLITPRPRKPQEEESDAETPTTPATSRPESSRLSQLINFADLIPRSEGREVKFPKDFIKAIDEKLQRIAIGKDAAYTDQYTRRTVAAFWGNFKDQKFVKQMKENRRIEELILMYVTSSTTILKKDKQLSEADGWKLELNKQVAIFIRILRETLRSVHHVPPELNSRLDMYANKVTVPKEEPSSGPSSAVSRKPPKERDSWVQIPSETSIADMPLVQTVGKLFGIEDAELQRDVSAAARVCTDRAAIVDLKTCLKNITVGMPFPGRREDFQNDAAYNHWKTTENLIHIWGRERWTTRSISHRFSTISIGDSDAEIETADSFTYIPPNPKKAYKRLVELCVDADLSAMVTLPEDQEVSLTILSQRNHEIINECAVRWRILQTYRVSCFLDVVRYKYEREEVPLETHKAEPNAILQFDDILRLLHGHELLARYEDEIANRLRELSDHIRTTAVHEYTETSNDVFGLEDPDISFPLLELSTKVEKTAKKLDKQFGEPLTGNIDLVSLVVESQIPLYLGDLEDQRTPLYNATCTANPPTTSIDSVFNLYRRVGSLLKLHAAFCPDSGVAFDLVGYFEPYVHYWIRSTDSKTLQWVQAAIAEDKFVPEGEDRNSSSVVDLFGSLNSPIEFILDLEWPDEYHNARFMTRLASTISQAIENGTDLQPQKQSAWLEKAKQYVSVGEKKIEVFNFTPEPCVKLNNIEAARKLLDNIQNKMQIDKIVAALEDQPPPPPDKNDKARYLFTVKVVQAENLVSVDNNPAAMLDTFVVFSDEHGNKLAKTKTIYDTLNPRWEETFDITVIENPLWVMASVRDRQLVGNHDTVGRGYLCLDPRRFGDFLTHDLWLDLEPAGRILVRVSMEGEKDDVMFYFGRAFRSLKRTEGEMARVFVNKVSPLIRNSLSRQTLKSLIKSKPVYDYQKAIGGITSMYRTAVGAINEPAVPLPPEERQQLRKQTEQMTDLEIEAAIAPLFDHFDVNLPVLHSNLSTATQEMIMVKMWKEILGTLENLLLPPLSDVPTDMKPLAQKEVEIVFKWLKVCGTLSFGRHVTDTRVVLAKLPLRGWNGLSNELLQNKKYRDLMTVPLYYDWKTDDLMEQCVREMQQNLRSAQGTMRRAKSVYSQNSLGTIKQRKKDKKKQNQNNNSDIIMRILRMSSNARRSGTGPSAQATATDVIKWRRKKIVAGSRASPVPPVPPLPR